MAKDFSSFRYNELAVLEVWESHDLAKIFSGQQTRYECTSQACSTLQRKSGKKYHVQLFSCCQKINFSPEAFTGIGLSLGNYNWHEGCSVCDVMLENLYTANNYVLSKKMLDASHIRHEALSNNIANVETPNYKRRDLPATFEKELNEAVERGDKVRLRDLPLRTEIDKRTKPIGLDGNNVELDKELLEINRNALNYTFLSQYVGGSIQTLNKAIKGHV